MAYRYKHQKNAGIYPKEIKPDDRLKEYQRLCDKIRIAEDSAKRFLDIYRENRGKWQEEMPGEMTEVQYAS